MFRKFDKRDYLGVFQNGGEPKNKTPYATPTRRKDHDSSFDFEKSKQFAKDINETKWRFERFHNNRQSMLGKKEYNPNDYRNNYEEFSKHRDGVSRNIEDASLFYSGDRKSIVAYPVIDEKGEIVMRLTNQTFSLPTRYDKLFPYVTLSDEANRLTGVSNQNALGHELGHFLYTFEPDDNGYSQSLVDKYMRPKDEVTEHDQQLKEIKSDIHSIREAMYNKGLYDPTNGKYKGQTGQFDSNMTQEMLNEVENTNPLKRLRYLFKGNDKGILEMINTFTNNNQRYYDKRNYQV